MTTQYPNGKPEISSHAVPPRELALRREDLARRTRAALWRYDHRFDHLSGVFTKRAIRRLRDGQFS
jgi:hypothetical protein